MSTATEAPKPDTVPTPGAGDALPPPGGLASWPACLAVFLAGALLDQATKFLAVEKLALTLPSTGGAHLVVPKQVVAVVPGLFDLRIAANTGAAFSMLEGRTGWLSLVSVAMCAGLVWWWTRLPARETPGRIAMAMIVSGAVGNLIDRARLGYVVDFLDVYWDRWHWPTFNIADSAICVGVGILLLQTMRKKL